MTQDVSLDSLFSDLEEELKEEGAMPSNSLASKSISTLIAELDDTKVMHLCNVHISSVVRKVLEGKLSVADSQRVEEIFRRFTAQLEACDVTVVRAARLRRVKSFTPFSSIKEGDI